MAKRTRQSDPEPKTVRAPAAGDGRQKRRKRLERDLAKAVAIETQRMAQLEKIRAQAAGLRAKLAALDTPGEAGPTRVASDSPLPGPTGYCMHERRRVTVEDFTTRTLANGRTSVSGTCSSCGGRVVALAGRKLHAD